MSNQAEMNDETVFEDLQRQLEHQYRTLFQHPKEPRTVVVVPSLSMHPDELAKISGAAFYEERLLCLLMLLKLPRTKLIFVTSKPIAEPIIDYYLHLLPGVPTRHARERLTLISAHDGTARPLSQKILERPRLLARIKGAIDDPVRAHLTCFNATWLEQQLSLKLGIPLYACNPKLVHLGNKSGSREIFQEARVNYPLGIEHLRDEHDLIAALYELKTQRPSIKRVVVKLNDGFSGEGNALFDLSKAPEINLKTWLKESLPKALRFEAKNETYDAFIAKFSEMQGIVEQWIEGKEVRSPSVQCRLDPIGQLQVLSTHDQVLGGPSGQVFLGATFPADEPYRRSIQQAGTSVAEILRERGALGRFAVDFISVFEQGEWQNYAIEINLRKGGTTHPFMMLEYLTEGAFDEETGLYLTPSGQARYYYASDNLYDPRYTSLTPHDLIDIAVCEGLHFNSSAQRGVVFHLIGALTEYGKLGVVCISDRLEGAIQLYKETIHTLDQALKKS